MNQFRLDIVTPDRKFFSGMVEKVILNTPTGEMEIMYHTLPMVAVVATGLIFIAQNGRKMEAVCSDGFVKVGDIVTIMAQTCNWPYEVNEDETNHEILHLNDKIKKAQSLKEYRMAKAQLAVQLAKLKIKDKKF